MFYKILADGILIFHLLFIVFALLGGLFVLYRTWAAFIHLPAAAWATFVAFSGWICPLTPLEKHFREVSGDLGYSGGFIEHYIIPVIYPAALQMDMHLLFGSIALVINLLIYLFVLFWKLKRRKA